MIGYILNFAIYTLAMIGLIILALITYKKAMGVTSSNKNNLTIDEKLSLNARKTLYIVKAGSEKFLIAADIDNTSLIAKLEDNKSQIDPTKKKNIDFEGLKTKREEENNEQTTNKIAVMKSLAKKLSIY